MTIKLDFLQMQKAVKSGPLCLFSLDNQGSVEKVAWKSLTGDWTIFDLDPRPTPVEFLTFMDLWLTGILKTASTPLQVESITE